MPNFAICYGNTNVNSRNCINKFLTAQGKKARRKKKKREFQRTESF